MQGTSLDLEDPPDLRITVDQRPTGRPGRHRLLTSAGRHRRVRRMAPVTAGVLTVVVAASTAVAGQFAHKADPELDVALPQPRASVSGGVATEPSPPPKTTIPTPTAPPMPAESPTPAESSTSAESTVTRQPTSSSRKTTTAAKSSSSHASPSAASRPSSGTVSRGCGAVSGRLRHRQHVAVGPRDGPDYSLRVADGGAGHTTAGRFEVRDGDTPVDSGERSEAKPPDSTDVSDGDERWYSFSMMFDKSFPAARRRMVRSDAVAPGELGPLGGRGFPCAEPAVRQRR